MVQPHGRVGMSDTLGGPVIDAPVVRKLGTSQRLLDNPASD